MAATQPSPFALGLAPLILRLVLGLIFTWSGLAKWMGTMEVKGEDAAVLANLDIIPRVAPSITPPPPAITPAKPLPAPAPAPAKPQSGLPAPAAGGLILAQTPAGKAPVTAAPPVAVAEDFPTGVSCRAMWSIALMLHHASHPEPDAKTNITPTPLWPKTAGEGIWPKVFAITVFSCELGGGILLLLGLFTRLGALAVASVMLGALWLTQFGPALQTGNATLGFLPPHDLWDGRAWTTFFLQIALLGGAFAVMLLGSGALSIDRAIAGYRYVPPAREAKPGGANGRPV